MKFPTYRRRIISIGIKNTVLLIYGYIWLEYTSNGRRCRRRSHIIIFIVVVQMPMREREREREVFIRMCDPRLDTVDGQNPHCSCHAGQRGWPTPAATKFVEYVQHTSTSTMTEFKKKNSWLRTGSCIAVSCVICSCT